MRVSTIPGRPRTPLNAAVNGFMAKPMPKFDRSLFERNMARQPKAQLSSSLISHFRGFMNRRHRTYKRNSAISAAIIIAGFVSMVYGSFRFGTSSVACLIKLYFAEMKNITGININL